jgi:hypothetical protein
MKSYKKNDTGVIMLSVFLISTTILLIINFFNLAPLFTRLVIVYVWLIEFVLMVAYVCLFHNIRQYVSKR